VIKCGKCLAPIPEEATVCPGCGFVLGMPAREVPELGPGTDLGLKTNKPFRIVVRRRQALGLIIGEVFLLLLLVYLFWPKK
jgi:hypothetical protein